MLHGIDEYEKFKVIRPIPDNHSSDCFGMPVIKNNRNINLEAHKIISILNLNCRKSYKNFIATGFNYDYRLNKFWNDPLKYIPTLQKAGVCCTPDYSIYPSMSFWEIAHNTYRNRWLGCLWQTYGIPVICTISWATPETYNICFSGVEQGNVVAISTLGCTTTNRQAFLAGYREMMIRIKPSLVIVFGKFINGIYGRVLHFEYEDLVNHNNGITEQSLFVFPRILDIEEVC